MTRSTWYLPPLGAVCAVEVVSILKDKLACLPAKQGTKTAYAVYPVVPPASHPDDNDAPRAVRRSQDAVDGPLLECRGDALCVSAARAAMQGMVRPSTTAALPNELPVDALGDYD